MNRSRLVDELGEIIYVIDPGTYELLFANEYFRRVMGVEEKDYIGEKCYRLIQGREEPCDFCCAQLKYDEFHVWEHTNPKIGRHLLLKDKLINWNSKPARLEIALDITDQENVSQRVRKKLETERMLVECIRALTEAESLEKAMDAVLSGIGDFYQAGRAFIMELNDERTVARNTYEWCAPGTGSRRDALQGIGIAQMPLWAWAVQRLELIRVRNREELRGPYPEEYSRLLEQGIHSLIAAPFTVQDKGLGYIGVEDPADNQDDPSLLQSLSYFVINEMLKRRMQNELEYRTRHDALTGLYNRFQYRQDLDDLSGEALASVGVVFCDINGLKQINDTNGHIYGDKVIASTAGILSACFEDSRIYRLSGDEFVVLCGDVSAQTFAHRIESARDNFSREPNNGVSLGYTWADADIDLHQMARHADELMYVNKQVYYKENPRKTGRRRPRMLAELLHSIGQGEFKMYLQPKADIKTGQIIGAEALVRHMDPVKGLIPPDRFIPTLEREKTIKYIDLFIFEQVCRMLADWQGRGMPLLPISLNFSRITMMGDGLMRELGRICDEYASPRQYIEIEITESVGELERQIVADMGKLLKGEGFGISLDDFGSKYSNMSMFTAMELDVLKLDRSLISDLVGNVKNRILVRHVIEACQDMGVTSIAEGVETHEQLDLLRTFHCDLAQGYLFGRPVPIGEFEETFCHHEGQG